MSTQKVATALVSVCSAFPQKKAERVDVGDHSLVVAVRGTTPSEYREGAVARVLLRMDKAPLSQARAVLHEQHDAVNVLLVPQHGFAKARFPVESYRLEWIGESQTKGGVGWSWEVVRR